MCGSRQTPSISSFNAGMPPSRLTGRACQRHLEGTYRHDGASSQDFPLVNPIQSTLPATGNPATFVSKVGPGGALAYSTYFGGVNPIDTTNATGSTGIAVDPTGNAYIAGGVWTTDFPIVNSPASAPSSGLGFLAKFDPMENILFSAYESQAPADIATDATGAWLYLAGPFINYDPGTLPLYVTRMDSAAATVSY